MSIKNKYLYKLTSFQFSAVMPAALTIFAAVATSTSDPMATVASKLGAKWSYQDGQTVNEETVDANLTGTGVTNFKISKPDGLPKGKYKLEVMLNGAVVQSREFEVK